MVFLDEYVNFLKKEYKTKNKFNASFNKNSSDINKNEKWDRKILTDAYKTSKFLSEIKVSKIQEEKNSQMMIFFKDFEKISFYYIARDCDQLSWITYYVLKLIKYNYNPNKLDIKLFLTTAKGKINSVDNFLFWRSLGKYQKFKEKSKIKSCIDFLTNLPIQVNYGRPEFEKYFEESRKKQKTSKDFYVYACGPVPILESVDKACKKMNENNKTKFIFFPEKF